MGYWFQCIVIAMVVSFYGPWAIAEVPVAPLAASIEIDSGELSVLFRDNSASPQTLSGVQSLFHRKYSPAFDAFDPQGQGSSAGLNFEHIISGHRDRANKFTPRHGPYTLHRLDERTVELRRRQEDSPWAVSSTFRYTVTPPHSIDFQFQCTAHDSTRFGERGYGIFFWANYMNQVEDVALHFLGIEGPDAKPTWIAAAAPKTHKDYIGGGTYRSHLAESLKYDQDHNFKLNVWSYDWPRYTRPFYIGRAANDMCLILMFDRGYSTTDEIRFSLFKFKVKGADRRPAWDFQYVIHQVEEGKQYGYQGRLVWKKFISYEDCLKEYENWSE